MRPRYVRSIQVLLSNEVLRVHCEDFDIRLAAQFQDIQAVPRSLNPDLHDRFEHVALKRIAFTQQPSHGAGDALRAPCHLARLGEGHEIAIHVHIP